MLGNYTLINGDCLAEMSKIPTGGVDVVFTSPPYNDSATTVRDIETNRHRKYTDIEYRKDYFDWQVKCIDEMIRVAKRMVLYNTQAITSNKNDVYRLIGHYADKLHQILIWYKPNAQPQPYEHRIGNSYEMVFVLRGQEWKGLHVNSEHYSNVIVKNINSNRSWCDKHRAIMSIDFANEMVFEFTKEGDTVLDPFSGLATTGVSCVNYGRNYIGIEISPEYHKLAEQRLQEETSQMRLNI